jgi:hypothetical protein
MKLHLNNCYVGLRIVALVAREMSAGGQQILRAYSGQLPFRPHAPGASLSHGSSQLSAVALVHMRRQA